MGLYYNVISFYDSVSLLFMSLFSFFFRNDKKHENRFLNYFTKFNNDKNFFCTSSARSGLYIILKSLRLKKNDEVIVCGFTCSAVIQPILLNNLKPIYSDIVQESFVQSIDSIKNKITSKTKVIIVQHTFGSSGPIEEVLKLKQDHNVFIIEDCALSLGNKIGNKYHGTFGDAAIWSFELSKTISVGWGGAVRINNNKLFKKAFILSESKGFLPSIEISRVFFQSGVSGILYNNRLPRILKAVIFYFFYKFNIFKTSNESKPNKLYKLGDFQWYILLNQLKKLDKIFKNKDYNTNLIINNLLKRNIKIKFKKDIKLIRFPLLVKDPKKFIKFMNLKRFEIGTWFSQPISDSINLPKYYEYNGECDVSEFVCKHIINIPILSSLNNKFYLNLFEYFDEYLELNPDENLFINNNN